MSDVVRDARHSLRMFWHSPGFTAAAVLALALGIGANTAIFSVVNAVLLKPVPFPEPDRLVVFQTASPQGAFTGGSPAKFQHWRAQTSVVTGRLRLPHQRRELHRRRLPGAVARRPGVGRLLPAVRRADRSAAATFSAAGGPARRRRRSRCSATACGSGASAATRRRHRQDDLAQRRAVHRHRHRRPGFDVSEFGPPPEVWIPFQLDPNTTDQGHYFQVGRPAEARRHDRAGARRG